MNSPLDLQRGPDWRNRAALAPLTNVQSNSDGTLGDDEFTWLSARARGGFGLTMTCAAYVHGSGRAWDGQLGIAGPQHDAGLARLADAIRAEGSVSSVQLHHGGQRAEAHTDGTTMACPWDLPERGVAAMTTTQIEASVEHFAQAAARAERAGFDGVEIHGAHGYLICQFMDARKNMRDDGYGGSLEGRSRFLWEVLSETRRLTGPDFQVGLRLSPEGYGIRLEDGREIARQAFASGHLDYIDMSLWDVFATPRSGGETLLIDYFNDLPRHGTRLGVAGKIITADDVRWCFDKGVDFVSVGFGAIFHHDWPIRVMDADFEPVQPPVSPEYLHSQFVSPRFVDYLAAGWADLVA